MAFPASTVSLEAALTRARSQALLMKAWADNFALGFSQNDPQADQILTLLGHLRGSIARWQEDAAVPGIGPYAQAQLGNGGLDIAGEFQTMRQAAEAARDHILANYPRDAQGRTLDRTMDANGNIAFITFPKASPAIANLVTLLQALSAAIA